VFRWAQPRPDGWPADAQTREQCGDVVVRSSHVMVLLRLARPHRASLVPHGARPGRPWAPGPSIDAPRAGTPIPGARSRGCPSLVDRLASMLRTAPARAGHGRAWSGHREESRPRHRQAACGCSSGSSAGVGRRPSGARRTGLRRRRRSVALGRHRLI
jgi:hypothetical protein